MEHWGARECGRTLGSMRMRWNIGEHENEVEYFGEHENEVEYFGEHENEVEH